MPPGDPEQPSPDPAALSGRADKQLRHVVSLDADEADNGIVRFGNEGGNMYYQHSDLGLVYSGLAKWIDLEFNYRQIFEKASDDRWHRENRPHLGFVLKTTWKDLAISDRSRFEFRDRENAKNLWRYRNKFTVKFPWKLTALKLQPYVADEVFINFNNENFSANRFYAGITFPVTDNLKADISYIMQSKRSGSDYTDYHVLGTYLKFKF